MGVGRERKMEEGRIRSGRSGAEGAVRSLQGLPGGCLQPGRPQGGWALCPCCLPPSHPHANTDVFIHTHPSGLHGERWVPTAISCGFLWALLEASLWCRCWHAAHSWSNASWPWKFPSVENVWRVVHASSSSLDEMVNLGSCHPNHPAPGQGVLPGVQRLLRCRSLRFLKQSEWSWCEWNVAWLLLLHSKYPER